ncbi:MAG: hypothetical protein M1372_01615 [Patescibacteria group bacterium]|nr:hypothetical protein [Patescibacteria group bacterium]
MQEVKTEESWNKKRLVLAFTILLILAGLGYGLKSHFLGEQPSSNQSSNLKSVKGVTSDVNSDGSEPISNLGTAVGRQLESIKKEASSINITEIATSSPQVQKIVNDIKNLQNYPGGQVKEACFKICSGL